MPRDPHPLPFYAAAPACWCEESVQANTVRSALRGRPGAAVESDAGRRDHTHVSAWRWLHLLSSLLHCGCSGVPGADADGIGVPVARAFINVGMHAIAFPLQKSNGNRRGVVWWVACRGAAWRIAPRRGYECDLRRLASGERRAVAAAIEGVCAAVHVNDEVGVMRRRLAALRQHRTAVRSHSTHYTILPGGRSDKSWRRTLWGIC